VTIDAYHGTTAENVPGIERTGLLVGSWVSPSADVAWEFARSRAAWNGQSPVLFRVRCKVGGVRSDRSGRPEAVVLRVLTCERVA
jgi:hypothetical protein